MPASVEECRRKGAKGVVVVTAGFGEVDAEERRMQEDLARICLEHGARLVGPNCMGLINSRPDVSLDATFSPAPALPGPSGFASQSGALGVAVLNIRHQRAIGFSQFIAPGDKADVSENDVLEAWEGDPGVPVIAVHLESISDARRFFDLSRRIARKKPVVLVKAGRTGDSTGRPPGRARARGADPDRRRPGQAAGDSAARGGCRESGGHDRVGRAVAVDARIRVRG